MRKLVATFSLILLLGLLGCDPALSIRPLVRSDELVTEPNLEGCWTEPDADDCALQIAAAQDGSYRVILQEDHGASEFKGRLARLGDQLFLDIVPTRMEERRDDTLTLLYEARSEPTVGEMHLLGAHSFHRVQLQGDQLVLSYLKQEWVAAEEEAGRLPLASANVGDGDSSRVVLTATTEALRAFLPKIADSADAFETLEPLYRQKGKQ